MSFWVSAHRRCSHDYVFQFCPGLYFFGILWRLHWEKKTDANWLYFGYRRNGNGYLLSKLDNGSSWDDDLLFGMLVDIHDEFVIYIRNGVWEASWSLSGDISDVLWGRAFGKRSLLLLSKELVVRLHLLLCYSSCNCFNKCEFFRGWHSYVPDQFSYSQ